LSAALTAIELSRGVLSAAEIAQRASVVAHIAGKFLVDQLTEGASTPAVTLAREVVKGMAIDRLKILTLIVGVCLLSAGIVFSHIHHSPPLSTPQQMVEDREPASRKTISAEVDTLPVEAKRPINVSGRVVNARGQPVSGVKLFVGYAPRRCVPEATAHPPPYPLRATSGTDGQFRFTFSRAELDEQYLDASRPVVIATADGHRFDWAELPPHGELRLKLVEDLPIEGRILDRDRRPVVGARVFVRQVSAGRGDGSAITALDDRLLRTCRGPLPLQPTHFATGNDGRFRITGVGRNRLVHLGLEGATIGHDEFRVVSLPKAGVHASHTSAVFDYVAARGRLIRGVVRDRITRTPVPGVKMSFDDYGPVVRTDERGRYELPGDNRLSSFVLRAQSREHPSFAMELRVPNKPGRDPLLADFELVGGISLRGRVLDQDTKQPSKRAVVHYYPLYPNRYSEALANSGTRPASTAPVQADGSYNLVVLPGPGVVLVAAFPRDWYATAWLDEQKLASVLGAEFKPVGGSTIPIAVAGRPGRRTVERYNAISLIKPEQSAKQLTRDLMLQPARGLRGTVVGPDGRPLSGTRVMGLTTSPDSETLESALFTVEGLNPRQARVLYFSHRDKRLGKVLTIAGDATSPLTIQLEPYGVVSGRIVNKAGQPVVGLPVHCAGIKGSGDMARTDRDGRFRIELVPGQEYAVGSLRRLKQPGPRFFVKSGESHDLGDVHLAD
jgi:hypothetical protein